MSDMYSLHIRHLASGENENCEREGELFKNKTDLKYKIVRLKELLDMVNQGKMDLPVVIDKTGGIREVE